MSRFVANRTLTSLSAIYRHYNAHTKTEKSQAIQNAYRSLNRSAKGRAVEAKIEKRRAASRKAAITRQESKAREQNRYRETVQEFYGGDEYDHYPDVPVQRNRNYTQRHAYIVRLQWTITGVTANGPTATTTYTMATYLSDTAMTVGDIDRAVWADYGPDMVPYGPMGDSHAGADEELSGWEIVAHYVSSTKGAKTHAA